MFKPEKLDNAFSALVYILIALLVLLFPSFVQYIIGGGFIIEGMLILAKPIFLGGKNEIA
jgi:hypothetical protein